MKKKVISTYLSTSNGVLNMVYTYSDKTIRVKALQTTKPIDKPIYKPVVTGDEDFY